MNKVIVTLTGPSASGKSTLEKLLCDALPDSIFQRVVSTTTREPRAGEKANAYHFVTRTHFEQMRDADALMEHVEFGGNLYGATKHEFERIFAGQQIPVVVCEPIGRHQIEVKAEEFGWYTLPVFITNPRSVRLQRLLDRFILDIHANPGESYKIRDSLVKRLEMVLDVEALWEEDAWQYDLFISAFNEKNQTAVLNTVTAAALNLLTADRSNREAAMKTQYIA